jgi:hypothetical protein
MKKSTLNSIMIGVIITLVIAISIVSIKLAFRTEEDINPPEEEEIVEEEVVEEEVEEEPEVVIVQRAVINADNINVRSGPGTDFERLGSAYKGNDFELADGGVAVPESHPETEEGEGGEGETETTPEQGENEDAASWTKIIYYGQTAYVYSQYVDITDMMLNPEGEYEIYVGEDTSGLADDIEYMTPNKSEEENEENSEVQTEE